MNRPTLPPSNTGSKLKERAGWFAAGQSFRLALTTLSDGAFKLFAYLCLQADRRTGKFAASHSELAAPSESQSGSSAVMSRNSKPGRSAKSVRQGTSTPGQVSRSLTLSGLTSGASYRRTRRNSCSTSNPSAKSSRQSAARAASWARPKWPRPKVCTNAGFPLL